jgi:ABC-type Mn2+/Zn2+ transport system ATPase subunit
MLRAAISQPSPRAAATPTLEVQGVSVYLGERLALEDVSFTVQPGSFVGLIGPNGSGKSTLLRSIMSVLTPSQGRVLVDGRPVSQIRSAFSYLPQRQQIELDVPLRAWDVAMMGRLHHTGWLKPARREDREVVGWALEQVGLADRRNSAIAEMSFGQQQRVFFARALAQQGPLILLDEPMNGVDTQTQELFVELLRRFHSEGRTIVMATHDLNQAAEVCDTLCVLNRKLVAYGPLKETLTEEVLRQAYGVHLHLLHDHEPVDHVLDDGHHHA